MDQHQILNETECESKYPEQEEDECIDISQCKLNTIIPKYTNIQEEIIALGISLKKYQRTYNKTKTFLRSFSKPEYKTLSDGVLNNKLFGIKESWKTAQVITVDELFALKLVVDYKIIQCVLNECTEQRLNNVYHLRRQLFIVLNKYGSTYFPQDGKLYLPVTEPTTTMGPLLVTGSSIVSDILSSKEGMTITIIAQSNSWKSFDVSKLSDYPHNQQWLIDFTYIPTIQIKICKESDNESPSKPICKI